MSVQYHGSSDPTVATIRAVHLPFERSGSGLLSGSTVWPGGPGASLSDCQWQPQAASDSEAGPGPGSGSASAAARPWYPVSGKTLALGHVLRLRLNLNDSELERLEVCCKC